MLAQFTTIGHSNRSLEEFLAMLRSAQVDILIDVRSFPTSRTYRLAIGTARLSAGVGGISRGSMKISGLNCSPHRFTRCELA